MGTVLTRLLERIFLKNSSGSTIDPATEQKQDAILADLQLKADKTETQPVSLATVPLATDAATDSKLESIFNTSQNDEDESLDVDELYVTQWYDCLEYPSIVGIIKSTQVSATNGVRGEWSRTGTEGLSDTPYKANDPFTVPANVALPFAFHRQARFFRVRYLNGGIAATASGQLLLSKFPSTPPISLVTQAITAFSNAVTTHGILSASDGVDYQNIGADGTGSGLNTHIKQIDDKVRLDALATLATGQANITDASAIIYPPSQLTDRRYVNYTNLDDTNTIWFSEDSTKLDNIATNNQGGALLPLRDKGFDLGPGEFIYWRMASGETARLAWEEIGGDP